MDNAPKSTINTIHARKAQLNDAIDGTDEGEVQAAAAPASKPPVEFIKGGDVKMSDAKRRALIAKMRTRGDF